VNQAAIQQAAELKAEVIELAIGLTRFALETDHLVQPIAGGGVRVLFQQVRESRQQR
jgi:hypothetical protein